MQNLQCYKKVARKQKQVQKALQYHYSKKEEHQNPANSGAQLVSNPNSL